MLITELLKKETAMDNLKIYGDRICKQCHGLCHENSWRDKIGQRKSYWCSDGCLIATPTVGKFLFEHFRDDNFEQVDVISR